MLLHDYDLWMERHRFMPSSRKHRLGYARRFWDYQAATGGHTEVGEVTVEDAEAYFNHNPTWAPRTRVAARAALKTYFDWALDCGLVDANVVERTVPFKVPRTVAKIAADGAITAAMVNMDVNGRAMILLAAEGGLRASEIAGLPIGARAGETLTVVGKGGHARLVPLSPELRRLLERLEAWRKGGYYFPGRAGRPHVTYSAVYGRIKSALRVHPHALRHRAATAVYRASGHNLLATQLFLGHARPTTTAIYVHTSMDEMARAVEGARLACSKFGSIPQDAPVL